MLQMDVNRVDVFECISVCDQILEQQRGLKMKPADDRLQEIK